MSKIESTTIKGEAFLADDALVQDQIFLITVGKKVEKTENTIELIPNVWENLLGTSSEGLAVKTDGKGFWYWEVEMTNMQDTEHTVKIKFPCPKPTTATFDNDLNIKSGDTDWTKYWKAKFSKVLNSPYNSTNGLQQKEVTLPGTKYVDQNGNLVVIPDTEYTRTDLGDIQNLLVDLY